MAGLTIYIGNKNYSSWSLRGWLALKATGQPFSEKVFDLSAPDVREALRPVSPSRRVPALRHGELLIWDSLAIAEYLAETFPAAGLWPADTGLRAVARAVCAEMHSGFVALRTCMPFNVRRSSPGQGYGAGVVQDIARIREIWNDCRARFGRSGPFLFGNWSLADVMYAPVASRFTTYAVELDAVSREYVSAVLARDELREWRAAAEVETVVEAQYDL